MEAYSFGLFALIICTTGISCQEIKVHPENATVVEGANITLNCKFSTTVHKCTWSKDGKDPVDINGRYEYVDRNVNGINTSDCSILITDFQKIDATKWQCAVRPGSEFYGIKSNFARLAMVKSNHTTTTTTPSNENSNHPSKIVTAQFFDQPYFILIVVSCGILVTAGVFTLIICSCRRTKRTKNADTTVESSSKRSNHDGTPAMSNTTLVDSSKALGGSTESICAFCHQQKPESCTPGEVWSAPPCKHLRDSCLPMPLEQLPPYLQVQLYENTGHPSSIDKSFCRTSVDSETSRPPTPLPPDYYAFVEDVLEKFPPDSSPATLSCSSSATTNNPVYETAPMVKTSKEDQVFFPASPGLRPEQPLPNVQRDRLVSDDSDNGTYSRIRLKASAGNENGKKDDKCWPGSNMDTGQQPLTDKRGEHNKKKEKAKPKTGRKQGQKDIKQ